eukprot:COSAG01_NODE_1219_length_11174_cov_9.438555_2_plen_110_part_00
MLTGKRRGLQLHWMLHGDRKEEFKTVAPDYLPANAGACASAAPSPRSALQRGAAWVCVRGAGDGGATPLTLAHAADLTLSCARRWRRLRAQGAPVEVSPRGIPSGTTSG